MEDIIGIKEEINPWIWNSGVILVSIIIGLILKFIILKFLQVSKKTTADHLLINSFLRHLGKPLTYLLPLFIFSLLLPLSIAGEDVKTVINDVIRILVIFMFSWLLIRIVRVAEDYVVSTYDLSKTDNIRERKIRTQLQYIRRIIIITIFIVATAIVLLSFEGVRQIGAGLLTSAGVAGIIIGFAAQRSLANLFAGFQIAFTQPIRIDDVLVVEGEWGRVEEITLTYVVVRIWDQRRLILPINYFIEKPFQNWTRISADILGTVYLYTDYKIPVDEIREELNRVLKDHQLWDGKVSVLQVTDAKETTIELRALMSARNSSDAWDLRCYVREKLVHFIQENYPESLPKDRAEISGFLKQDDIMNKEKQLNK